MNTKNCSEVRKEKLETLLTIDPNKTSAAATLIHSEEPAAVEKSTATKVQKKQI